MIELKSLNIIKKVIRIAGAIGKCAGERIDKKMIKFAELGSKEIEHTLINTLVSIYGPAPEFDLMFPHRVNGFSSLVGHLNSYHRR